MKSHARSFVVETKSRRRQAQGSQPNWTTAIEEPSRDDMPGRDVHSESPFAAATRVFSAFATSAVSSASTFGELAASVFTSKPQDANEPAAVTSDGRTGRILPSLLPINRFDGAEAPTVLYAKQRKKRSSKMAKALVANIVIDISMEEAGSAAVAPSSPELTPLVPKHGVRFRKRVRRIGACAPARDGSGEDCPRRAGRRSKLFFFRPQHIGNGGVRQSKLARDS
jgi:hypothetical protein